MTTRTQRREEYISPGKLNIEEIEKTAEPGFHPTQYWNKRGTWKLASLTFYNRKEAVELVDRLKSRGKRAKVIPQWGPHGERHWEVAFK